jgi:hypothetical protein
MRESPHAPLEALMEQSPTRRRDVLTLQEACHALDAAEMYEQCNEVYQVLFVCGSFFVCCNRVVQKCFFFREIVEKLYYT